MTTKENHDRAYIAKKVAHMKRMGLVSGQSTGIGKHGGAAPDWLISRQKEEQK